MLLTLHIPLKEPKKTFKVSKSFKTKSIVSDRTLAVAEGFGIGIDEEKVFPVFQDFHVEINPGDIIYVTGESGGGKSILLRELYSGMLGNAEFGKVAADWELKIPGDEALVHGVGATVEEALKTLSLSGLNEAFLWLRRFSELSDGQRYRYKVAKLIDSKADTWIFDEFCATLDRDMARIVAFSVQKVARRLGKTVVAATTHVDLEEDLAPSVHIHKGFMAAASVDYAPNQINPLCSIAKRAFIRAGSKKDYSILKEFHYRAKLPIPLKIYALCLDASENVIGVIVYSPSPIGCAARRQFMGKAVPLQELQGNWCIISRVILHPRFRSIGLGVKLVRETLPSVCQDRGVKYVEAVAVMARYNPFFAKAGMQEISVPDTEYRRNGRRILEALKPYGFEPALTASKHYNVRVLKGLSPENLEHVVRIVYSKYYPFLTDYYFHRLPDKETMLRDLRNVESGALASGIRKAAIAAQGKKYFVWTSEHFKRSEDVY